MPSPGSRRSGAPTRRHPGAEMGPLRGRLLVATPPLEDPNFDRTVVFMIEHTHEGAVGVVLNRPGPGGVVEQVLGLPGGPAWRLGLAEPQVAFTGGPVQPDGVIALAEVVDPRPGPGFQPVLGALGTVDIATHPDEVAGGVRRCRVFHGYAGWGPGQLEDEIERHAWLVADARPDDVFAADPERLWRRVLGRLPGRLGWLALFPDDPVVN
jgi:putative transcriptional regulator